MSNKSKALQELIHLIILSGGVFSEAMADGKIDFADMSLLFKLFPAIQAALPDVGQIPAELSAMDANEGLELVTFIGSELQLTDEHAKKVVEEALKTVAQILMLVKAIKN